MTSNWHTGIENIQSLETTRRQLCCESSKKSAAWPSIFLHWKITLIVETSEYLFLYKGTLGVPLDCMHVMPCVTMYCSLHVQMCVCTSQLRIKKSEGQAAKTFFYSSIFLYYCYRRSASLILSSGSNSQCGEKLG